MHTFSCINDILNNDDISIFQIIFKIGTYFKFIILLIIRVGRNLNEINFTFHIDMFNQIRKKHKSTNPKISGSLSLYS